MCLSWNCWQISPELTSNEKSWKQPSTEMPETEATKGTEDIEIWCWRIIAVFVSWWLWQKAKACVTRWGPHVWGLRWAKQKYSSYHTRIQDHHLNHKSQWKNIGHCLTSLQVTRRSAGDWPPLLLFTFYYDFRKAKYTLMWNISILKYL